MLERVLQRQLIAPGPKAADHADRQIGEKRMMSKRFTSEDIRQVHFDKRNLHRSQRVAQRYARMGKSSRIDQDEACPVFARLLNTPDQLALEIALKGGQGDSSGARNLDQTGVDRIEGVRAVDRGFACTQQIEVGAMQYQDASGGLFRLLSWASHDVEFAAASCKMSRCLTKFAGYWDLLGELYQASNADRCRPWANAILAHTKMVSRKPVDAALADDRSPLAVVHRGIGFRVSV